QDAADSVDSVARHGLVPNVGPVHYSSRRLVPQGSLILRDAQLQLGPYDPDLLGYTWRAPDAGVDALQAGLASIAERAAADGEAVGTTFLRIRRAVAEAMNGRRGDEGTGDADGDADDMEVLVGARSGA